MSINYGRISLRYEDLKSFVQMVACSRKEDLLISNDMIE